MWKRVICYIPQGSGGDQILGGWIRLFVPYNSQNNVINGLNTDLAMFDLTKSEPISGDYRDYYEWQYKMKEFYLGAGWDEVYSSLNTTPAKLIDYNYIEYNVEFYSGFYEPHFTNSNEVRMNIGYRMREDSTIKNDNLKSYYQSKGVVIKGIDRLEIPKYLQKHISEILSIFNMCIFTYVGLDPEEEMRKEFYIGEGVKKEIINNKFGTIERYYIPQKYKNNELALNEIRSLFNIHNIKYIDTL